MIEPKSAVGMKGQVGDDIATAYFHQSILHKFGLDEKVRVDVLEFGDQRATGKSVEISPSNQSHLRITSSTGINGRLKAVATPSWVIFPSEVLSPFASALFLTNAWGKPRLASSRP